MKTQIAFAALAAGLIAAGSASATQLLANGNFDAGNTGFTSQYVYSPPNGTGANLWPEGTYDVTTNPNLDHPLFASFGDHTPAPSLGEMMVVNGASAPNTIVWSEGSNGAPLVGASNTAYTFSFWVASVYPDSPADLQLWINGQVVNGASFQAEGGPAGVGNWQEFTYSGVTGSTGLQSISLSNLNLQPSGNDFALDDMSLTGVAVPEPTSWALMLVGFGGLGALLRSRRRRGVLAAA
ncbi:PEPxxWA-CTERM sorting domain-containing protein [Phenylobacterium sp.]|uniref:PEPxxWA-CTERM sorting domain-containing protein n=1 Tax=Phenylobacterium sp. TaxID=1871053 RepID=UPI0011F97C5C|nr:PEPxxWA-CTERM sorting domain-containing protein [Phenylobacterium sp.]THD62017.1 MAG: PEP-CTERM sorting domain-containing protein [Phenylobacterium sp.]